MDAKALGIPISREHQPRFSSMPLYGRSFLATNGPGRPYSGVGSGSWENGVWHYRALPGAGPNVSYLDQPIANYSYDVSQGIMISYEAPEVAQKKAECKLILATET